MRKLSGLFIMFVAISYLGLFQMAIECEAKDHLTILAQGSHNEESAGLRWFISRDNYPIGVSMTYAGNKSNSGQMLIGPMVTMGDILGVNMIIGIEPGIMVSGDDSDNAWIGNVLNDHYFGNTERGDWHYGMMLYCGAMIVNNDGIVMRFDIASYYEQYDGYTTILKDHYTISWDILFMVGYKI